MDGEVTITERYYAQQAGDKIIKADSSGGICVIQLLGVVGRTDVEKVSHDAHPIVILGTAKQAEGIALEEAAVLRGFGQSVTFIR